MASVWMTVAMIVPIAAGSLDSTDLPFRHFNGSAIDGCCPSPGNTTDPGIVFAGVTQHQAECEQKCAASAACTSYTWHSAHPIGASEWALTCVLRTDGKFPINSDAGIFSGEKPCPGPTTTGSNYSKTWCSITQHPMPSWFEDAKFGIYAHWGPYSVPAYGSEWYSRNMYVNGSSENQHSISTYGPSFGYKDLVPLFTAPKFNATEWAAIYHRSGARYAGPVAEHADGFAMFKSRASHWNAFEMGPKRDIVGELASAIRQTGLRLVTTLHHQWLFDWYPTWDNITDAGQLQYELTADHGGLYGPKVASSSCTSHFQCDMPQNFMDYFNNKTFEVIDQYQPDVLYFDSRLGVVDEQHRLDFLAHYYNSDLRWQKAGTSSGVIVTYKGNDLQDGAGALDFERGGSSTILPKHWQTDDAMDRGSWSWVNPPNLKNESELIDELADIVSKNGNLLLDIPPHADGSIDPRVQRTLFAIGDWLEVNGQAIFASRPWTNGAYGEGPTKISSGSFHEWPTFTSSDFRFTRNAKALFAIAMAWSDTGHFVVKSLNSASGSGPRVTSITLLGGDSDQPGSHTSNVPSPLNAPLYFATHLSAIKP